MRTAEFDYDLPDDRIAQRPLAERDASRLLVDTGPSGRPRDAHVRDLADLLEPGDLLVVNQTRVLRARLHLVKPTGGAAEVLLLEPVDGAEIAVKGPQRWEALVRPSRRLPPGTVLTHPETAAVLEVEVLDDLGEGRRIVELRHQHQHDLLEAIEATGEVPLPPYITEALADPERYQTIMSTTQPASSVAASTASLHFTQALGSRLAQRGIDMIAIDLVVGMGTFRPIAVDEVEDHVMHRERYRVSEQAWNRICAAPRVVAVGTTSVRTLESVAATGELEGRTGLFIHGDYPFQVVDRLMTNFHQPRSSLLVMIESFVGPRWRELYAHALRGHYRFLSFGDAMLLTRHDRWDQP